VNLIKKGQSIEGVVKSIQPFGAFVEVSEGVEAGACTRPLFSTT
jgi:ribosomal protein S1